MVSIIIPCYNCESFIHRAIQSVVDQTYKDWELLLVNNNSTDGTQLVLESYKEKIQNISIFQETKKGAPAARNKGLKYAKGKWVQYLDADDELLPQKLEKQVKLAEHENVDCVIGNAFLVEEKAGTLQKTLRPLYNKDVWIGLIKSQLGITSAILWKREILEKVQGWNENMTSSQEYDLMFRLLKSGAKAGFDSEVLTLIHKADSTISKNVNKNKMVDIVDNRIRLRLQIMEYLQSIDQLSPVRKSMAFTYIYQELRANQIDIKEYERTRLQGASLRIPGKVRLNTFLKDTKRSLLKLYKART